MRHQELLVRRFDLVPHGFPLEAHIAALPLDFVSLASRKNQSSPKQPYLEQACNCQERGEKPSSPVSPIASGAVYRHGGKVADRYGMLGIVISICFGTGIGATGLILIDSGWRAIGWLVLFLGLTLIASACASAAIGCLPWGWRTCLHDAQEHSQNQVSHFQAAFEQNTGSIPSSCVS